MSDKQMSKSGLKINFVLPFLPTKPVGGAKIMFEYANRLALLGHSVIILFSIKRPFKKSRTPPWLRYILVRWRKKDSWFTFHSSIQLRIVKEITNEHVPDADVTIATWWQMTYAIASLASSKGKKINLIQDYEIWTGQKERVHESYFLPVYHVVIANHLADKIFEITGQRPIHIPNAIDTNKFYVTVPINERNSSSIIMLYSEEPRKGSSYGLQALKKVKSKFPDLQATLFSVYSRPADIPDWIEFYQKPEDLPLIYNHHAIFFSPSLGEGWALPPAEAMACGCAVVCTNIGGHHDYSVHEETALLVPSEKPEQMANELIRLIEHEQFRHALANKAVENIAQFSWEESARKLESVMKNC